MTPAIDFVMVSGDITANGLEVEYASAKTILDGLSMPCYTTTGNHDGFNVGYPRFDALWTRHHVIDSGSFTLVVFDAIYDPANGMYGKVEAAELLWIEAQLQTATKPVILSAHYPLIDYRNGYVVRTNLGGAELTALCQTYGVRAYLAGHLHLDMDRVVDANGMIHVNGPSTVSTALNTNGGFVIVNAFSDRTELDYRDAVTFQTIPAQAFTPSYEPVIIRPQYR
jgi:Icc protein